MANPPNPAAAANMYAANMYAANNAQANNNLNGMPAAGHYSDMQTLMQNMEALSGWLQQNREDFSRVQEGLEAVERRNARQPLGLPSLPGAGGVNGDASANATSPAADPQAPTLTSLQRALDTAQARVQALEDQNREHQRLQAVYEDTLTEATERIRNYIYQQSTHLTQLHHHYTTLLSQSRGETLAAQNLHYEWQGSLSNLNEELKKALKAREEEKDPFRAELAALKAENRALRGRLGWEVREGESDEEDGGEGGEGGMNMGTGPRQRERVLASVMGASSGR